MTAQHSEPRCAVRFDQDCIYLSGALDFDSVLEVEDAVQTWLKQSPRSEAKLNLSAVTFSNSAGIALLLGWMRSARAVGCALRLQQLPADLRAMAEVSGLTSLFEG